MLAGMIVASRKINEGFGIGHGPEIRLKVVEIRGDEVLIGVDGPAGTSIELDPPPSSDPLEETGMGFCTPPPSDLQDEIRPTPSKKRSRSVHKKKRLRSILRANPKTP